MDYKKVLRLHYINSLSGRAIAESSGYSKTAVNDFLKRFRLKRIRYYSRIQLLFIDDFAISRYPEQTVNILYHLIKMRTDYGTSTMYSCQYAPDEWGKYISDDPSCYGKLDGVRRRLTNGYTVLIRKTE